MDGDRAGQGASHPWVESGQRSVRFGVVGGPRGEWSALRDFVQMADDLGFDAYWRPDHPLLVPDCWTSLAALATSTRRLRLGSLVSCVCYRNPVVLARAVADVDRISQGRAILGLGAGNIASEFHAMGLPYPSIRERHAALADTLQIVPHLLRGETVTHAGAYYHVEGATLRPPAAQQPYVPLLVGGGGEQTTLRLVAQYADASGLAAGAWGGGAATEASVRRKHAALRDHCTAIGRAHTSVLRTFHFVPVLLADSTDALAAKRGQLPQELLTSADTAGLVGTPEQAVARLLPLVEAGCQYFTLAVLEPETLRLLGEHVIPAVRAAVAPILAPDP